MGSQRGGPLLFGSLMTTKRVLVKRVAERAALTQAQAGEVVELALEAIMEAVLEDRRIELRRFGVFEVRWRQARKARDPRTGETMPVPARHVLTFRPCRALEEEVAALPQER